MSRATKAPAEAAPTIVPRRARSGPAPSAPWPTRAKSPNSASPVVSTVPGKAAPAACSVVHIPHARRATIVLPAPAGARNAGVPSASDRALTAASAWFVIENREILPTTWAPGGSTDYGTGVIDTVIDVVPGG